MKHILLAVTGMTPQVVTETLYALAVAPEQGKEKIIPEEIHIISTATGLSNVRRDLIGNQGALQQLIAGYNLPPIKLDETTLYGIKNQRGDLLSDITTPEDNLLAADTIANIVRKLCANPDIVLHASLAGGRKSMGFFMGYALSLYAREQDTLSHVLVNAPFESLPNFFYPTPQDNFISTATGETVNSKDARIMLATIPIVRLRDQLPKSFINGVHSYRETIEQAQYNLNHPHELILSPAQKQIICDGIAIALPPTLLAVCMTLADCHTDARLFEPNQIGMQDYLENYAKLTDHIKAEEQARTFTQGKTDFTRSFHSYKSKLNQRIAKHLPFQQQYFAIISHSDNNRHTYQFSPNLRIAWQ